MKYNQKEKRKKEISAWKPTAGIDAPWKCQPGSAPLEGIGW